MSGEARDGLGPALRLRGAAQCRRWGAGWCIEGSDAATAEPVQIRVCGAELTLPATLVDVELAAEAAGADGARGRWQLRHGQQRTPLVLNARAVQIHREVAHAFYQALPPVPVTWGTRARWWLLLNLLRVPGLAPWLQRLRGQT